MVWAFYGLSYLTNTSPLHMFYIKQISSPHTIFILRPFFIIITRLWKPYNCWVSFGRASTMAEWNCVTAKSDRGPLIWAPRRVGSCALWLTHTTPPWFPATSSISYRHAEMGARFSGKMAFFSGGRACNSREIGYTICKTVIKDLVLIPIFTLMFIFLFTASKRGWFPPRSVNLASILAIKCLHLP